MLPKNKLDKIEKLGKLEKLEIGKNTLEKNWNKLIGKKILEIGQRFENENWKNGGKE